MAKAKHFTISMDPDLMERIDMMSKVKGGNRSVFIAHACTQYMDALARLPEAKKQLQDLAEGIKALQNIEI